MKFYATLGTNHGGPGCIEIEAENMEQAREMAFAQTKGRFAFIYDSIEDVHKLDRKVLLRLPEELVYKDGTPVPANLDALLAGLRHILERDPIRYGPIEEDGKMGCVTRISGICDTQTVVLVLRSGDERWDSAYVARFMEKCCHAVIALHLGPDGKKENLLRPDDTDAMNAAIKEALKPRGPSPN